MRSLMLGESPRGQEVGVLTSDDNIIRDILHGDITNPVFLGPQLSAVMESGRRPPYELRKALAECNLVRIGRVGAGRIHPKVLGSSIELNHNILTRRSKPQLNGVEPAESLVRQVDLVLSLEWPCRRRLVRSDRKTDIPILGGGQ